LRYLANAAGNIIDSAANLYDERGMWRGKFENTTGTVTPAPTAPAYPPEHSTTYLEDTYSAFANSYIPSKKKKNGGSNIGIAGAVNPGGYGSGGHMVDFLLESDVFSRDVKYMRNAGWIDEATRMVSLAFSGYNRKKKFVIVYEWCRWRSVGNNIRKKIVVINHKCLQRTEI
jgi:hypothetical protein